MSIVNKKVVKQEEEAHLNWYGNKAYFIKDPILNLKLASASCFFGEPMYYHKDSQIPNNNIDYTNYPLDLISPIEWRSMTPKQMMESAIDKALDYDPEITLKWASTLRNEENIRLTPQIILIRAANHPKVRGTGLIRKYAPFILKRADEPSNGLAYQFSEFSKVIPNSIKRAYADYLSNLGEYSLAKYKLEGHEVNLFDVVNLVHPKSEAIHKLMNGKLSLNNELQTWESFISTYGSTKENWTNAIHLMGHMALLRNLRNLLEAGVDPNLFIGKLIETTLEGKQLPFRYYSAYKAIEKFAPKNLIEALEICLLKSMDQLPRFPGKTLIMVDNSGSMQDTMTSSMGTFSMREIANLTAILTSMNCEDATIVPFGNIFKKFSSNLNNSIFRKVNELDSLGLTCGGGTVIIENLQKLLNEGSWDRIFIYSDMQAGYESHTINYKNSVPAQVKNYHELYPNAMFYFVQMGGYQDTLIPEYFDKVFLLGGWSDSVLKFASTMEKLFLGKGDF